MRMTRALGAAVLALLGAAPAAAQHHDHAGTDTAAQPLPAFVPAITAEDRAAAFPADLEGHHPHDRAVNYFVLVDQFDVQRRDGRIGVNWDARGWVGRDKDRLWFRTEGETDRDRLEDGEAHLLYGRAVSRWWDVVAGVRQDFQPGPSQTWAAVGLQGLAPYWFEVEATAYVGPSGRTEVRLETEYELLLTNRLVLQPLVELQLSGKDDPERGTGAGLSTVETGLRLRYEIRRELAPYVGVVWTRKVFGTADYAEAAGESARSARLVFGVRFWR